MINFRNHKYIVKWQTNGFNLQKDTDGLDRTYEYNDILII